MLIEWIVGSAAVSTGVLVLKNRYQKLSREKDHAYLQGLCDGEERGREQGREAALAEVEKIREDDKSLSYREAARVAGEKCAKCGRRCLHCARTKRG